MLRARFPLPAPLVSAPPVDAGAYAGAGHDDTGTAAVRVQLRSTHHAAWSTERWERCMRGRQGVDLCSAVCVPPALMERMQTTNGALGELWVCGEASGQQRRLCTLWTATGDDDEPRNMLCVPPVLLWNCGGAPGGTTTTTTTTSTSTTGFLCLRPDIVVLPAALRVTLEPLDQSNLAPGATVTWPPPVQGMDDDNNDDDSMAAVAADDADAIVHFLQTPRFVAPGDVWCLGVLLPTTNDACEGDARLDMLLGRRPVERGVLPALKRECTPTSDQMPYMFCTLFFRVTDVQSECSNTSSAKATSESPAWLTRPEYTTVAVGEGSSSLSAAIKASVKGTEARRLAMRFPPLPTTALFALSELLHAAAADEAHEANKSGVRAPSGKGHGAAGAAADGCVTSRIQLVPRIAYAIRLDGRLHPDHRGNGNGSGSGSGSVSGSGATGTLQVVSDAHANRCSLLRWEQQEQSEGEKAAHGPVLRDITDTLRLQVASQLYGTLLSLLSMATSDTSPPRPQHIARSHAAPAVLCSTSAYGTGPPATHALQDIHWGARTVGDIVGLAVHTLSFFQLFLTNAHAMAAPESLRGLAALAETIRDRYAPCIVLLDGVAPLPLGVRDSGNNSVSGAPANGSSPVDRDSGTAGWPAPSSFDEDEAMHGRPVQGGSSVSDRASGDQCVALALKRFLCCLSRPRTNTHADVAVATETDAADTRAHDPSETRSAAEPVVVVLASTASDVQDLPPCIRQCFVHEACLRGSRGVRTAANAEAAVVAPGTTDVGRIRSHCAALGLPASGVEAWNQERLRAQVMHHQKQQPQQQQQQQQQQQEEEEEEEGLNDAVAMAAADRSVFRMGGSAGSGGVHAVRWEDVGGLSAVKAEIVDLIELPSRHPALFPPGLRRIGVLLHGPPGTGKTLVAKAVANECNMAFVSVKGPELLDMYVGESERKVRAVFADAARNAPCVLFFDELDSLAPKRGRGADGGGVMDRVVSQLLTEMDALRSSSSTKSGSCQGTPGTVFVIGATNRPDLLDPSLLRPGRFDRMVFLGPPTTAVEREDVLRAATRQFTLAANVCLADVVATLPPEATGASIAAVARRALLSAVKRTTSQVEAALDEHNSSDPYRVPLTIDQFLETATSSTDHSGGGDNDASPFQVLVQQEDFLGAATAARHNIHSRSLRGADGER